MSKICTCYDELWDLYSDYKSKNNNLSWTHENESKFIDEVDKALNCFKILLEYLENLKTNTNASKDEYRMLLDILNKYNKELKVKANLLRDRINKKSTASILAVDNVFRKTDPNYNASYLKSVLPTCPGKRGGKSKKTTKSKTEKAPKKKVIKLV